MVSPFEKPKGQILQFGLDPRHPEPVCQGRIDLAGLESDAPLPLAWQMLERAHVVQSVRELDDDHAGVLRDREEELPIIFHLFFGRRPEAQVRDLGEPIHDRSHLFPEGFGDLANRHVRVLDRIVQQRGRDGDGVHLVIQQDARHGHGMGNEVVARHPLLTPVSLSPEAVRSFHELEIDAVRPFGHGRRKSRVDLGDGSGHNNPASANEKYRPAPTIT